MTRASRWLRRAEITLWVCGISLLGVALGATWRRADYQAQQQRAFLDPKASADYRLPPVETPGHPVAVDQPSVYDGEMDPAEAVSQAAGEALGLAHLDGGRPAAAPVSDAARQEAAEIPGENETRAVGTTADSRAMALIEIPRIGLSAFVRAGVDKETLDVAVGYVPGTALPGEDGNFVLAGHRDTFFRPLRRIRVKDRIRIVVPPNTYEYEVVSLRVVEPQETGVLDSSGVEELTLVTCYPFRYIGPAPRRFIVNATRVP